MTLVMIFSHVVSKNTSLGFKDAQGSKNMYGNMSNCIYKCRQLNVASMNEKTLLIFMFLLPFNGRAL